MPNSHHGYSTQYDFTSTHQYSSYIPTPNSIHIQPAEYRTHIYDSINIDLNTSSDSLDIESSVEKKISSLQNFTTPGSQDDIIDEYNSNGPIFTSTTSAVTSEHVQELDSMCNLSNAKNEIIQSEYYTRNKF